MVEVARMSPITGKVNKMNLPITEEDYTYWLKGRLLERIKDKLTPEELEFVTTGKFPGE
jgi:hypothetical protein